MARRRTRRLWASLVARIVIAGMGRLVGWVYRWNTGREDAFWIAGPPPEPTRVEPLANEGPDEAPGRAE